MILPNLNKTAHEIYLNNKEKGFWDLERNKLEMLMLIVSELAEAAESIRVNKHASIHDMTQAMINGADFKYAFMLHVKDSFEDEIADALIRILDMCGGLNIDIERHVDLKIKYNLTREHKHGKSI